MISNHAQFLAAITEKKLINITYHDRPNASPIVRDCAPLDYGPDPNGHDLLERYWLWDPTGEAGSNFVGLSPGQIVRVRVLSKSFDPTAFALGDRRWTVKRSWETTSGLDRDATAPGESPGWWAPLPVKPPQPASLDALLSRTIPRFGERATAQANLDPSGRGASVRRSLMLPAISLPFNVRRSEPANESRSSDARRGPTPSGFGQLIQQEYALQRALEHDRVTAEGSRAADTVRILEYQQTRTNAVIALLDSECARLPHAGRFQPRAWRRAPPAAVGADGANFSGETGLAALVTLHLELKKSIEGLAARLPHEGTGREILDIVVRDHEEMAWMLTALLNAGAPVDFGALGALHGPREAPNRRAERWENEGGALVPRVTPPVTLKTRPREP